MSSDRFHKAAKDGLLEVLKEATRKDTNTKDDDSMTPVLWAAFEGRLDALRLLCGRGGDPDKYDQFGNTALHLASAKGHLHCVDFLVKFGVNIYAMDIDKHSAKDLAAINNRDNILRYLDAATASFEAKDKKKARALREMAEKNCEKRMREYKKRQQKLEAEQLELCKSPKLLSTLKQKIWSSQGNLHRPSKDAASSIAAATSNSTKFSELVGAGSGSSGSGSVASRTGTVQKKPKPRSEDAGGDFKIGEIEANGRRTITSLSGVQRDSEVLYVGTFSSSEDNNGRRGKISDVFEYTDGNSETECETSTHGYGKLTRSYSQPDVLGDEPAESYALQRPAGGGLFDRPPLGSLAFRRSVTAALCQMQPLPSSALDVLSDSQTSNGRPGAGAATKKLRGAGKCRSVSNISDSDSEVGAGYSDDDQDVAGGPMQRFLTIWSLEEYLPVFQKQQIDLDTLMLLTEPDLKSLGLPLGPFRKLSFAIQQRRNALAHPGVMQDSFL